MAVAQNSVVRATLALFNIPSLRN